MTKQTRLAWLAAMLLAATLAAQRRTSIPELRDNGPAVQMVVDGKPFLMLAGELHNSSASSLAYMEKVWPRLVRLNLNTILATLSWELVEPSEGQFDFSLIDGLVAGARTHDLKVVFTWFGSWKNSGSSYVPGWVKKDTKRFPRTRKKDGETWELITPLAQNNRDADTKAFKAVMRHIRKIDSDHRTVLMMQVENELGILSQTRDLGPLAQKAFAQPVPQQLIGYLKARQDKLRPEVKKRWEKSGAKESGTWTEIFGEGAETDEIFMAWHYALYVQEVVAAGKAEYPLPMYVNAWLARNNAPGEYPTGGPVSKMMDIWRAGAPDVDLFAPDVYDRDFKAICADYTRSDNPLLVPELGRNRHLAGRAFWAFAQHAALGFSPFGVESLDTANALIETYDLLDQLTPLIARYQGTDKLVGIFNQRGEDSLKHSVEIGGWEAKIEYSKPDGDRYARGLIVNTGPDEFVVAGNHFSVRFDPSSPGPRNGGIERIEEGKFLKVKKTPVKGRSKQATPDEQAWQVLRVLNGDETAGGYKAKLPPNWSDSFSDPHRSRILRVKLYRYD